MPFWITKRRKTEQSLIGLAASVVESGVINRDSIGWVWEALALPESHNNTTLTEVNEAAYTVDVPRLTVLAGRDNAWLRFSVASNPQCPNFLIWGDGISSLGLAGDDDKWVAAAAIITMPHPMGSVVENIKESVGVTGSASGPVTSR